MNMVDMKMSKKDMDETEPAQVGEISDYPYSLRMSFDDKMKAIGLDGYAVGDEVELCCKGTMVRMETTENEGQKKRTSCEVQIKEVGLMEETAFGATK